MIKPYHEAFHGKKVPVSQLDTLSTGSPRDIHEKVRETTIPLGKPTQCRTRGQNQVQNQGTELGCREMNCMEGNRPHQLSCGVSKREQKA